MKYWRSCVSTKTSDRCHVTKHHWWEEEENTKTIDENGWIRTQWHVFCMSHVTKIKLFFSKCHQEASTTLRKFSHEFAREKMWLISCEDYRPLLSFPPIDVDVDVAKWHIQKIFAIFKIIIGIFEICLLCRRRNSIE